MNDPSNLISALVRDAVALERGEPADGTALGASCANVMRWAAEFIAAQQREAERYWREAGERENGQVQSGTGG